MTHETETEPAPPWLLQAIIKINKLPENSRADKGRNAMARLIVRSIEREDISASSDRPEVWFCEQVIQLRFWFGAREVKFYIKNGYSFRVIQSKSGIAPLNHVICNDFADAARRLMDWLVPIRGSSEAEIMGLLEVKV